MVPAVVVLCTALAGARAPQSDMPCLPYTLEDILAFLKNTSAAAVLGKANACGVTVIPNDLALRALREAGADDELIRVLAGPQKPEAGERWTPLIDKRQMVWIPAGAFQMGTREGSVRDDDEFYGAVRIDPGFWMDEAEVSNDAFRLFLLAQPEWRKSRIDRRYHDGNYLKEWPGDTLVPRGEGNLPVVNVSWFAAAAYARWAGKRLPTEAEWEYAARAGTTTTFWWGDTYNSGRVNDGTRALPVGGDMTRQNPWGLYDVLGNVWEWTSSMYIKEMYRRDDGREDIAAPGERSVRGGAFRADATMLRAANRNHYPARTTNDQLGFRCAR